MLSRALLYLISIELVLYAVIALGAGFSPGYALLLALAGHILLRALLVVLSFLFASWGASERPPEARIGPLAAVRMVLSEIGVTLLLFSCLQPLAPFLRRPPRLPRDKVSDPPAAPLVLVHGYLCNAAFWYWMRRYLQRAGFSRIYTLDLEPPLGDIDELAVQLAQRVEQVSARTGATRVLLLCHSMGGLVARAYVRRHGGLDRVMGIVTLGSPHRGTALARLAMGVCGGQMRLPSVWLQGLAREEEAAATLPLGSVFSWHDNLVTPQDRAVLPGAAAEGLSGIGHMTLGFSPRAAARARRLLRSYQRASESIDL
jgi:pimeloyl-ACP methyl ester carboxylesterase